MNPLNLHEKPLADPKIPGLKSFRYHIARNDYVMIGATDIEDAISEAQRSVTEKVTLEKLEEWNGSTYQKVSSKK